MGVCIRVTLIAVVLVGCAGARAVRGEPAPAAADDEAAERQLRGHLARARGCYDEARGRNGSLSGWVRVAVHVSPESRLSTARVVEDTSGDATLAECVESRLSGLYFDPAPTRAIERVHDFVLCPHDAPGLCALGPVKAAEGAGPDRAVAEALGTRAADIERCAAERARDGTALLDVELRLEPNGRILSGRVRESVPARTALRACAVGPILGLTVPGVELSAPVTYRMTYAIRPATP